MSCGNVCESIRNLINQNEIIDLVIGFKSMSVISLRCDRNWTQSEIKIMISIPGTFFSKPDEPTSEANTLALVALYIRVSRRSLLAS